jgi:hypothetical protein
MAHRNACYFSRLIFCFLGVLIFTRVSAQVVSKNNLVNIAAAEDTFRNNHSIEKLYLQFDKPYYEIGDTIWFKAYLFNAANLLPSVKSGLLYIELANDSNKVIKRMMLPVSKGLSWGNIYLNAKEVAAGNYTLRAYTNWMLNFGEIYIFKKSFYFGTTTENSWLVNTRVNLLKGNGADTARLHLQFNLLNREPLILKDINLKVLNGDKTWYKSKLQTKTDGSIDVNFVLKVPAKHITLIAEETNKGGENHRLIFPVTLDSPGDMDIQFMPEGGNLVAGLPARLGFKALAGDGHSTETEGLVYDSKQQQVAEFKSVHKGMGAFDLIPQAGENYTAKIILPGGAVKTVNLPPVKITGTVLKIRDVTGADSLAITVTSTQENGNHYLIGQSRGIVCYEAVVSLVNNAVKSKISTAAFPTGIARFTLLNAERQPLNDRLIFINHHDNLQIAIHADKPSYTTRDSIALQIHVTDKNGNAVKGNFSLSATDDNQVKTDSINSNNIISNLLLTTDLKGDIEDPGYYFQPNPDGNIKQQLDNLLLTQGWVGYDWKDMFDQPKPLLYPAEPEFTVRGSVTNIFNKPVANTHVIIFSKKPLLIMDTVTNKNGLFIFRNIVPLDTPVYLVQARNKNGRSFNINAKVDELKPPVFAPSENAEPWYVNSDTALTRYVKNNIAARKEQDGLAGKGHVLKEVVISAKKVIKDSQNLNGPGNADVVIDEQELEKAGKKTFLDLLQERIPGFKEGFMLLSGPSTKAQKNHALAAFIIDGTDNDISGNDQFWYYINNKPVKFIIDGIPLYKIMTMSLPAITNINDYLKSHSAEDIKGIEVMTSGKYGMRYIPIEYAMSVSMNEVSIVEITTRSGSGPGIHNTPGTYLYKPLPFSLPGQFYSPRYTVKNRDTAIKDYRSIIYWKPNIFTDKDGNAKVSFYSADKKGTYTVILEGTDSNGAIGSKRYLVNIKGN